MASFLEEGPSLARRRFVAGAAVAAGVGMAAGCGGLRTSSAAEPAAGGSDPVSAPEPIDESLVVEEYECEVCVVGAGNAGAVAALTAVEAGADVIVVQKHDAPLTHGSGGAFVGSKMQHEMGVCTEDYIGRVTREWIRESCCQPDMRLFAQWRDHSGETLDWICDEIAESGRDIFVGFAYDTDWETTEDYLLCPPSSNYFTSPEAFGAANVVNLCCDKAAELGARFLFSHVAERLEREGEGTGRATAVLARREDGSYVRVKATKAIILCSGGYEHNAALRAKYLPHAERFECLSDNDGEGLLMAAWQGAVIEDSPHCSNIHYDALGEGPSFVWGAAIPWLRVDSKGRRVGNEDVSYGLLALYDAATDDGWSYQIFDSDFDTYYPLMTQGATGFGRTVAPAFVARGAYEPILQQAGIDPSGLSDLAAIYEGAVAAGTGIAYKAGTIAELAEMAGIDPEGLQSTVDRYNELYDAGEDADCYKKAERMQAVRTPPFYCVPRKPYVLGTLKGLKITPKMEVVDASGEPIEGLYAAGNCSGGLFGGLVQAMAITALTIGRAYTFGRLAAQHAVADN